MSSSFLPSNLFSFSLLRTRFSILCIGPQCPARFLPDVAFPWFSRQVVYPHDGPETSTGGLRSPSRSSSVAVRVETKIDEQSAGRPWTEPDPHPTKPAGWRSTGHQKQSAPSWTLFFVCSWFLFLFVDGPSPQFCFCC